MHAKLACTQEPSKIKGLARLGHLRVVTYRAHGTTEKNGGKTE